MNTDLPVSNPPTVDDALRALERYKDELFWMKATERNQDAKPL